MSKEQELKNFEIYRHKILDVVEAFGLHHDVITNITKVIEEKMSSGKTSDFTSGPESLSD